MKNIVRSIADKLPLVRLNLAAIVIVLMISVGCGGGGGSSVSLFGRSFSFSSGGRVLDMSVDPNGRFTIYVVDPGAAASGVGAQGSMPTNGQFSVSSSTGGLVITGQVSSDATTVSGTVKSGASTLFTFTATLAPAGITTPSSATGTYSASGSGTTVLLTADPTDHATLWANANGTIGGGLLTIGANGALATSDGSTTAQWNFTAGTLTLTKLNGIAVNVQVTLVKITKAKWTFLVYLNGANNLQSFGPLNFCQMEEVGSTSDVNIVVQWKQATCTTCGSPNWNSTRRYFVTKNTDDINQNGGNGTDLVHSTLVQDLGPNVDAGDYTTLRNFVAWGQQNYPADHYALVIWDHGAGWYQVSGYKAPLPRRPRAVSFDDSTLREIEVWQLPLALNANPKLDMVVFDASLMQMLEVAYEIRNNASVIVGSEESPPGYGYPYHLFLADLASNPNMTGAQFGTDIVNKTFSYYQANPGLNPDNNITQSAVDATKLGALASSMDAFANILLTHAVDQAGVLAIARNAAENYDPSLGYGDFRDLYDYADKVRTGVTAGDLQSAASNTQQALLNAVIANKNGSNHPRSHGLSLYVPAKADYISTYTNLAFGRDTRWPQWLLGQTQ